MAERPIFLKVQQSVFQLYPARKAGSPVSSVKAILFFSMGLLSLLSLSSQRVAAQAGRQPITNAIPVELQTLLEKRPNGPTASAETPSQEAFTVPSLWWTNQQFGEKLVLDWQAYGVGQVGTQQINVIVRPELWTRYTYFERYAFVLKFGSDASNFGYHLIVLDSQEFVLGAYTCDFVPKDLKFIPNLGNEPSPLVPGNSAPQSTQPSPCRLWLNPNYPREVF